MMTDYPEKYWTVRYFGNKANKRSNQIETQNEAGLYGLKLLSRPTYNIIFI